VPIGQSANRPISRGRAAARRKPGPARDADSPIRTIGVEPTAAYGRLLDAADRDSACGGVAASLRRGEKRGEQTLLPPHMDHPGD
jgi:hypothetical protein